MTKPPWVVFMTFSSYTEVVSTSAKLKLFHNILHKKLQIFYMLQLSLFKHWFFLFSYFPIISLILNNTNKLNRILYKKKKLNATVLSSLLFLVYYFPNFKQYK